MINKRQEIKNAKFLIEVLSDINHKYYPYNDYGFCGIIESLSCDFQELWDVVPSYQFEDYLPRFYKFHYNRIKNNKKSVDIYWWKKRNTSIRIKRLKQFYNLNDATFKK